MEQLALRYKQLLQAYHRLDYMTNKFAKLSLEARIKKLTGDEEDEFITRRDSLIKRFEFCYDLTWKFLKLVLIKKYSVDVASPRKVFQECYQLELITSEETAKLVEMIEARNLTSHVYDEIMADAISLKILEYYPFLVATINKIRLD